MKTAKTERQVVPMDTLRTLATTLEGAVAEVLDEPTERHVHRLRTSTRRLEAQLELFRLLAAKAGKSEGQEASAFALPALAERKLTALLTELRKTAGHVRDLDVQAEAVESAGATAEPEPTPASAAEPAHSKHRAHKLRHENERLLLALHRRRKHEAHKLTEAHGAHARKLAPRLEALLAALAPAAGRPVAAASIGELTWDWFNAQRLPDLDAATDTELHDIRKRAKLARYLAESAGLPKLAAHFEAIQEAGGEWHDNLALAALTRKRLGKRAELAALFERRELHALRKFRSRLDES